MERMSGIEPPSYAWQAYVLTIVLHPRGYLRFLIFDFKS